MNIEIGDEVKFITNAGVIALGVVERVSQNSNPTYPCYVSFYQSGEERHCWVGRAALEINLIKHIEGMHSI